MFVNFSRSVHRRDKTGRPASRRRLVRRSQGPFSSWRRSVLRAIRLLPLAGLVLLCWQMLPDYYSRWTRVSAVMRQIDAGLYHEVRGGGWSIRPGLYVDKGRLFERLHEHGYRLDGQLRRPGTYQVGANLVRLKVPDGKDGRCYELRLAHGAVAAIATEPGERLVPELSLSRVVLTDFLDSIWEVRLPLGYSDYPESLVQAVLSAEDGSFFDHPGIDFRGMIRAALVNSRKGSVHQGGSTITQQLIKTISKRTERTYREKVFEVLLALHLELVYTKQAILTAYLNNVYLGHIGPYALQGLAAGARYLLGGNVGELSPGQCALLAGMIKAPNALSPLKQPVPAAEQAARVLRLMKERGVLAKPYLFEPPADPAAAGADNRGRLLALAWAWQELERELNGNRLDIVTPGERATIDISIDPVMQQEAASVLAGRLTELEERRQGRVALQGALASVDQRDGGVKVLVGGRDFLLNQYNRASMARRPVGSLIKPFVYLAAMRPDTPGGPVTPATRVADTPMRISTSSGPWRPLNYDRKYLGTISLEEALIRSRNIPAVRIGLRATLDRVVALVQQVGINPEPRRYPSLFLGSCSSNALRLAAAYGALGRDGTYVRPQLIDRVTVAGSVVFARRSAPTQVIDVDDSRVMSAMLQKVLVTGTGKGAVAYNLSGAFAGKTGTSSDLRDSWFAGYSPTLTTVVWIGNDDNKPIGLTGAEAALPVWASVMARFGGDYDLPFTPPSHSAGSLWVAALRLDSETAALGKSSAVALPDDVPISSGSEDSVQLPTEMSASQGASFQSVAQQLARQPLDCKPSAKRASLVAAEAGSVKRPSRPVPGAETSGDTGSRPLAVQRYKYFR